MNESHARVAVLNKFTELGHLGQLGLSNIYAKKQAYLTLRPNITNLCRLISLNSILIQPQKN